MSLFEIRRNGRLAMAAAILAAAWLVAGCSEDDPGDVGGGEPDPQVAASLAGSATLPGVVGENLNQIELFTEPMSTMLKDAGLYQETTTGAWTGAGTMGQKAAQWAEGFCGTRDLNAKATRAAGASARILARAAQLGEHELGQKTPGDTLFVEYYNGPDVTGLAAVIQAEGENMVRYVALRIYPFSLGAIVREEEEILLDTSGTLEDDTDDLYHSAFHQEEHGSGEVTTGTIEPVSGSGPMIAGVEVEAIQLVEDPRFHPLQEWTRTRVVLDVGDFTEEGDEILYSLAGTVHWRNGAENHGEVDDPGGGPIDGETVSRARGSFTAAPTNPWLESVVDTVDVQLGDLEDEADDLFHAVSRNAVLDGIAVDGGSPRSRIRLVPAEPVGPGEEPCGGEAEQEVWYPATWWLVHLVRELEADCTGGGTLHDLAELRDGTSYERTLTWDGAGNATVSESRLDGTTVAGTFSESTGAYAVTTTFPAGSDPTERRQHGVIHEFEISAYDVYDWADGHADSSYIHVAGNDEQATITGYRYEGELREDFSVSWQEDTILAGTWQRSDGASGDFTIEVLEGGGQHLEFSAEEPNAAGEPSIEGELWFAPDGSGHGTIAFTQYGKTVVFEITIGPDGSGEMTGGGQTIPL